MDAPTLKVIDGAVADVRVRNIAMRKSLKPWPVSALENARATDVALLAATLAGAAWVTQGDGREQLEEVVDVVRGAAAQAGVELPF